MDPDQFFAASRVVIVAGKGGVGKTVVTASLARAAASRGLDVLVVDVQGGTSLGSMFGAPQLTYDTVTLWDDASGGQVRGRLLSPDEALVEWLEDHGMKRVARRMARSGVLEVVATATPGIKDLLVLAKVKQLERAGAADLILIDAPAAGHAITFMQSPATLAETARVGAINRQAAEVLEMLGDRARCRVVLVTLPEETPVNELVETAFALEDEVGVALAPVVVNGVYPVLDGLEGDPPRAPNEVLPDLQAAAALRWRRQHLQANQIARLAAALPLEQLMLPQRFGSELSRDDIGDFADDLLAAIGALPDQVLA
ncbi:MAG: P-loop NTPase [Acidimicrobiia bacterium]|nr:P-loop NTPase [Acidimicrobiia bacterium]